MTNAQRTGSLALAVALLAALLAWLAPLSLAATTSQASQISCSFSSPPTFNAGNAYASTIVIDGPDSVEPGEEFTVTIDANPMQNGPVAVLNPDEAIISAHATVSGDAESTGSRRSATWSNPAPLAPNEQYDISPRPISVTAGASEGSITVTFDLIELFATTINTSLWCGAFSGGSRVNPSLTIPVAAASTTTTATDSSSTTTTDGGSTTTTDGDTTTTTVADTTTTTTDGETTTTSDPGDTTTSSIDESTTSTEPEETTTTTIPKADSISKSASVVYGCTPIVSGSNLGTESATQTITFTAPDRVNPGDDFTVTMKMSPGPESGPIPLAKGTQQFRAKFKVTGGGSPSTVSVSGGTNGSDIPPNSIIRIPAMRGKVTATGAVGDSIGYAPSTFTIDSPSLDARTVCEATSSPVILSTQIVAEPVAVSSDGSLPATGLSDYVVPLGIALFALYVGGLALSTLPRRTKEEPST